MDQHEESERSSEDSRISRRKFLKGAAYTAPTVMSVVLASTPSYGFGGGSDGGGEGPASTEDIKELEETDQVQDIQVEGNEVTAILSPAPGQVENG